MASIKDVMYSQSGENLIKQRLGKDFAGFVMYEQDKKTGKVIYPEDKEWYIFKLVDSNKKGGVRLSNIDDVMNPETKRVERIRLLSGIDTIWQKQQKDLEKDYAQQHWVELRFFRNQKMLRISKNNTTALEFLRLTNSNIGNPNRVKGSRHEFFEYDAGLADKQAYQLESLQFEMETIARNAKLEQMKKHAAFLGISLVNELGEARSEDGIRKDYARRAKNDPDYFKQTLNDKTVEISWLVRKAIAEGLIDVGRERGKAFWAKNGGMIGVYPQNQNAQDYLTDLANTNTEDGIRFKEQLKQVVG